MEKTTKALVKKAKGPGNLALMDWPVPEIGDGDLLIQVKAAGICGSDLRMKNLGNSENLCAPVVVGHEFAGVIAAVGKNVNGFQVGQRVASDNSGTPPTCCVPTGWGWGPGWTAALPPM